MDKRNKTALAYLLIGVAAAGRALLAVPEAAAIQEVSLTVLALVGYLLLAGEAKLPIVFGAAGLVLELILSGAQSGGAWVWLEPALRAVDLWLFWGAALVLLIVGYAVSDGTSGYSIADIANQPFYLIAVGVMVIALLLSLVMIQNEKQLPRGMRPE